MEDTLQIHSLSAIGAIVLLKGKHFCKVREQRPNSVLVIQNEPKGILKLQDTRRTRWVDIGWTNQQNYGNEGGRSYTNLRSLVMALYTLSISFFSSLKLLVQEVRTCMTTHVMTARVCRLGSIHLRSYTLL